MSATQDIDLVRQGYEAFQRGDLAAFDDILAEGCVWHVPGRGQLAGDKKGRAEIVAYFAKLGELSAGTVHVDLHDLVGNDEHVVGLQRTSATRDGKSFETTETIVFHVKSGLVTEAWEHPFNLYDLDEVFA